MRISAGEAGRAFYRELEFGLGEQQFVELVGAEPEVLSKAETGSRFGLGSCFVDQRSDEFEVVGEKRPEVVAVVGGDLISGLAEGILHPLDCGFAESATRNE